jgi:predicted acetyltransferase
MPIETARLVRPDIAFRDSYLDAVSEFNAEGRNLGVHTPKPDETFDDFILRIRAMDQAATIPDGFVPQTNFWLVDGDTYIGRLSLRHYLNDSLRLIGGHIGYAVRPSMRCRGYGTQALALGLDEARRLGLTRVLLTCDQKNIASRRIIERNGGVLEDEITIDDPEGIRCLYWMTL